MPANGFPTNMRARQHRRMDSPDGHGESPSVWVRRDDAADARDAEADRREREHDIREGVLDRWERDLTERASSLHLLDDVDEEALARRRAQRAEERRRRRAEAEQRHEEAIDRAVERAAGTVGAGSGESLIPLDDASQRAIEQLAALADSGGTLTETLNAILAIATDALADAAAVTVALPVDGQLEPAAATATWAGELDAVQLRRRAGPIGEAIESHGVVVSPNLAGDARWDLAGAAGPDGSRAVLSAPIMVGGGATGVLTFYAPPGRQFERRSVLTAAMLAAQASLAIGWSLERLSHRAQTDAWERALASRDQIGQAKGILMEQYDLTAEGAFELLRATSQRHNTKVRDIAEHVVNHRRLPEPPTSSPSSLLTT